MPTEFTVATVAEELDQATVADITLPNWSSTSAVSRVDSPRDDNSTAAGLTGDRTRHRGGRGRLHRLFPRTQE